MQIDVIEKLVKRLEKINVKIELVSNFPWIYIYSINNIIVKEKNKSEHGFVIGYHSLKDEAINLTYSKEMFKLIKKYVNK